MDIMRSVKPHRSVAPVIVLYHGGCNDGIASAWVAHTRFGEAAEYVAWYYGNPLPDLTGKLVYLLDISLTPELLESARVGVVGMVVIDHHASTLRHISHVTGVVSNSEFLNHLDDPENSRVYLMADERYSGAVLSWMFFNEAGYIPENQMDDLVPRILLHIQDYDLWTRKLRGTNQLNAWLRSGKLTIDRFTAAIDFDGSIIPEILPAGDALIAYDEKIVATLVRDYVQVFNFDGISVATVGAPSHLRNEVADLLVDKYSMVVTWTVRENLVVYSLRSDGGMDVSLVAERFGGGGHIKSASFTLPANGTRTQPLAWLSERMSLKARLLRFLFK